MSLESWMDDYYYEKFSEKRGYEIDELIDYYVAEGYEYDDAAQIAMEEYEAREYELFLEEHMHWGKLG